MNEEEAIIQLHELNLDWEENGLDTKLNQTDINAIKIIVSELDIANKKLDVLKEEVRVLESHMDFIGTLNRQLDRNENKIKSLNNKLTEIKKHCNLSTTYEFNEIKNNHNSFDHQRIINNNNEILSIIGGE